MTNDKTEFPNATLDASEPVRMTNKYAIANLDPSMNIGIGGTTPPASLSFHSPAKEVMRISKDGVWVDPDLTTDEAAKAVIAALDEHIKFLFAKKDTAMRQALAALSMYNQTDNAQFFDEGYSALEDALK